MPTPPTDAHAHTGNPTPAHTDTPAGTHAESSTGVETGVADIAMVGLGVMGRSLALNLADHGFTVAVNDLHTDSIDRLLADNPADSFTSTGGRLIGAPDHASMIAALKLPRRVFLLVPAGAPTDAAIDAIAPLLDQGDTIIDGGNAHWNDTARRSEALAAKGLHFIGCGVSGGEEGARFGPSLMPGGPVESYASVEPMLTAVAAKVDPKTGKPIEGAEPRKPVSAADVESCCAHIGPGASGHFVKMVHNGIEYADMQLIAEVYDLLRRGCGMEPAAIADAFAAWDAGPLDSFLIEITADILRQTDPRDPSTPFVDIVHDAAGQKGTGRWTSLAALDLGVAAPTVAEAVFARAVSASAEERAAAQHALPAPAAPAGDAQAILADCEHALLAAKIIAYAQGFAIIRSASQENNWSIDGSALASIWRGGCIIRARLLEDIRAAYAANRDLPNLVADPAMAAHLTKAEPAWRRTVAAGATLGVPIPALSSALSYYDALRSPRLPAALIQGQRDHFGAHTYKRIESPAGASYHLNWHTDRAEHRIG